MNPRERDSLAQKLRAQRGSLAHELDVAEDGLQSIAESRESELEERAQEERSVRLLSQLDLRTKREIEEIDAALDRIKDGTYGRCSRCRRNILLARLRAVPTALYCLECARAADGAKARAASGEDGEAEESETPRTGALPGEMAQLSERDTERSLRELVHEDGRVDCEELRIVCRHGVVHLDGAVPSEPEHRILLKLVTEVAGFTEVIDRLQVNPLLWERDGRGKEEASEEPISPYELDDSNETDDVVRCLEEGLEWTPSGEPPPDEE